MVKELIRDHFYEIQLPDFKTKLYISLEQSYDDIKEILIKNKITTTEADDYVNYGNKSKHINARTTLFIENDIVLIKMNYFDYNIRSISILLHEIIHASKKILYMYESSKERELEEKEESECYLTEYIFEEFMCFLKPLINYNKQYRDMSWLYEITHKFKEIN